MRVRELFGTPNGLDRQAVLLSPPQAPTSGRRGLPKGSYVYFIRVNGVVRYIGKGNQDRMFAHMKEVR
jgi:hypothetical protein